MSAQPQRQICPAAQPVDRPSVRVITRHDDGAMAMQKPAAESPPRYDFVGIAG